MNDKNQKLVDNAFLSVEVELPEHLYERLMTIPQNVSVTRFWNWSWGLPLIFLLPSVLWLFVKNSAVIGDFAVKIIEWLMHQTISVTSTSLFPITLVGTSILASLGLILYLVLQDQTEYRII